MRAIWRGLTDDMKSAVTVFIKAIRPPITPMLILKALLGIVLFFAGIIFGVWLIIRYRRLPG